MLIGCMIHSVFHFRSECFSVFQIMFSLWFLLLKWLWRYDFVFSNVQRVFIPQNNHIDAIWLVWKVVALGFCSGKHSYLQSTWNVLDGVLVFVSLIDILVSLASTGGNRILGILRVLRLLRTLRPLRWVSERSQRACLRHGQSMKSAIQSLLLLGNKLKVSCVVALSPEPTR